MDVRALEPEAAHRALQRIDPFHPPHRVDPEQAQDSVGCGAGRVVDLLRIGTHAHALLEVRPDLDGGDQDPVDAGLVEVGDEVLGAAPSQVVDEPGALEGLDLRRIVQEVAPDVVRREVVAQDDDGWFHAGSPESGPRATMEAPRGIYGARLTPPSTLMFCPVMYEAPGESRNATTSATSPSPPGRPMGMYR